MKKIISKIVVIFSKNIFENHQFSKILSKQSLMKYEKLHSSHNRPGAHVAIAEWLIAKIDPGIPTYFSPDL